MVDGYARTSGKVPFLLIARPGLPNAMANIFNAYRDRIPMIVSVDNVAEISRGRFGFEEIDDLTDLASPITAGVGRAGERNHCLKISEER